MGLKNINYKINGYEYPEVYAIFNGEIKKLGDDYIVGFNVHASRELALTQAPLEVKHVRVKDWDRKSNLIAYAYQKGKETIVDTFDVTTLIDGPFTGWYDDVIK